MWKIIVGGLIFIGIFITLSAAVEDQCADCADEVDTFGNSVHASVELLKSAGHVFCNGIFSSQKDKTKKSQCRELMGTITSSTNNFVDSLLPHGEKRTQAEIDLSCQRFIRLCDEKDKNGKKIENGVGCKNCKQFWKMVLSNVKKAFDFINEKMSVIFCSTIQDTQQKLNCQTTTKSFVNISADFTDMFNSEAVLMTNCINIFRCQE